MKLHSFNRAARHALRTRGKAGFVSILFLLALGFAAGPAFGAAARKPPGDALFNDGKIRTFQIDIAAPALETLKKNERAYVPATVTVDGRVFKDVGVHLKGMGSFQSLGQKPSFSVKFDKYTPDQDYLGLSKIMLNNSAQDGTYLAELMATQMFRDAQVPAARVTHAFVEQNGRKLGLYVLIEAMNKDFLKQHFQSAKGNLYEAYLQDIDQQLDLDGGADTSQSDRKRLLEVCTMTNVVERWAKLPEVFNVDSYLSHCALEMFVAHTDGYALNRNNYRLYHDPSAGRFTMITHGLDWGFANAGAPVRPPYSSIITRAVIGTPAGREAFQARQRQLFTNHFRLEIVSNRVATAVTRLKAAARDTNEARQFAGYGQDMLNRISTRYLAVSNKLAAPEPQPLRFGTNGMAILSGWRTVKKTGNAALDITPVDGRTTFYIKAAGENTVASWRTSVILPAGKFRFTGEARAAQVTGDAGDAAAGAGLRISGGKLTQKLSGEAAWTKMEYEFEVTAEGEEKELVCELRCRQGEAWFDSQSLRLTRVK